MPECLICDSRDYLKADAIVLRYVGSLPAFFFRNALPNVAAVNFSFSKNLKSCPFSKEVIL